jgi:trehalose 6-phosphate phosphatase
MLRKPETCESLPRIVAEAVSLCMRYPGALVENKGSGIALHWRAAPEAETALRAFANAALERLPGYRLQPGHCVIELLHGDQDKGTAIMALLEDPPFHGRRPVFAGDDLTDESGFRAVNARGGDSILIGRRDGSAARFSLPDPTSVHAWLATPIIEGPA